MPGSTLLPSTRPTASWMRRFLEFSVFLAVNGWWVMNYQNGYLSHSRWVRWSNYEHLWTFEKLSMAPLGIEAAGELGTSWMKQLKVRAVFSESPWRNWRWLSSRWCFPAKIHGLNPHLPWEVVRKPWQPWVKSSPRRSSGFGDALCQSNMAMGNPLKMEVSSWENHL